MLDSLHSHTIAHTIANLALHTHSVNLITFRSSMKQNVDHKNLSIFHLNLKYLWTDLEMVPE